MTQNDMRKVAVYLRYPAVHQCLVWTLEQLLILLVTSGVQERIRFFLVGLGYFNAKDEAPKVSKHWLRLVCSTSWCLQEFKGNLNYNRWLGPETLRSRGGTCYNASDPLMWDAPMCGTSLRIRAHSIDTSESLAHILLTPSQMTPLLAVR